MLENIDKKNPFRAPENYFEDFHADIMNKISEEPKAKIVPLWKRVIPWASVAAVVTGAILSIGIFTDAPSDKTAQSVADTEFSPVIYASTVEEDDFFLYLEDELIKDSYYETIGY